MTMGYQFVHLENYSRKADAKGRNINFIISEAARRPEASTHVDNPLPPVIVYGLSLDRLRELHDAAVSAAQVTVAGGKGRKIRTDQKTLHTVVASHPLTMEEVRASPTAKATAEEWERLTVKWLSCLYGEDLKCVIRHEDESHYHLHAYVLPESDPEMRAIHLHPGVVAKREIMAAGPAEGEDAKALSKRGDAAYKEAMRAWQDSYHEAVAIPSGLTRLGPQRRRLTRDEWQREKVQAQALAKTVERARLVKAQGDEFIRKTNIQASQIAASARAREEAARQVVAAAKRTISQSQLEQERARLAVRAAVRKSATVAAG